MISLLQIFLFHVACFTVILTILLTIYFKWSYGYWKRKNLPYLKPVIPFGTTENPFKRKDYMGISYKKQYDRLKAMGCKHGGLYIVIKPVYIFIDPEYVKYVFTTDFRYFSDHGTYYNEKDDPLSAHLFSLGGQKWKNLRAKLTPTFTSAKLKIMIPTIFNCGHQLGNVVNELYVKTGQPMDVHHIINNYIVNVVETCIFGLHTDSFVMCETDLRKQINKLFEPATKLRALKNLVASVNPELGRLLKITTNDQEAANYLLNFVKEIMESRKKSDVTRKDFIQILMDLKGDKLDDAGEEVEASELTYKEVAAQVYLFLSTGFDASTMTLSCCLYELAMNPEIQQRVREEVVEVLTEYDNVITYEAAKKMTYMGQVLNETLRLYPPASLIPRICIEDYKIPGTEAILEKGTPILFPILGYHMDPDHFPEPEKFDPDRFTEENKNQRHQYAYMPFGHGPRMCISRRFAILQIKIGLAILLKNYKFSVNRRTGVPLKFDPYSYTLSVIGGIWLDVEKIKN